MRTTLNLDDQLFRAYKMRAAQNGTTLASEVEEALRAHLARLEAPASCAPFAFPVVRGALLEGVDYTSNAQLADLLDPGDPDQRR